MPNYYVDDGGDGSDGSTWAKAYTSLSALDDAVALGSGDIVYIGHDHVCQFTHSANRTITGPTSGKPCILISVTQGSNPLAYQRSSTNQIDTSEGAYTLTFDGCFAAYGVQMLAGAGITFAGSDSNEFGYAYECTFKPGNGTAVAVGTALSGGRFHRCTFDYSADTGASSAILMTCNYAVPVELVDCTFASASNRTGSAISSGGLFTVSGCDFTSLTNATACEIVQGSGIANASNCLTASTWAPYSRNYTDGEVLLTNVGPADAPTYCFKGSYYGDLTSSTAIYRTGGGSVEGTACAWLVTTTADCSEGTAFYSPWLYGTVTAGSKTFTTYITNDTADLTNAEAWMELEYLITEDEAIWDLATDQRATILTTAAAQADDTASTWNGTGPSFTYKQSLAVTATVGEAGQYRARVAVAKASVASSAYLYLDPLVTVT